MHAIELLHTTLEMSSVVKHKQRLKSLLSVTKGLFNQGKLSLTSLGRHLTGKTTVKHKIKGVDYLLGNGHLHNERIGIYRAISQLLLGGKAEVVVLVDWSPCVHHDNQILKASAVFRGRSVTLYEEVHPEKKLGNYKVHRLFLERLKTIIPAECHVTIVTDAGFRTEWFTLVLQQGWDFVGRIRSNMQFQVIGKEEWKNCLSEYDVATQTPTYRGNILLSKENKLACFMYLYKEIKNTPKPQKKKKKMGTKDKEYRKSAQDPWLLVSSLGEEQANAAVTVVNIYKKRMKVEHEFRDTKDVQWGIGMAYTLTKDPQRLQILLLIGHLALFALWLIGLSTEHQKLHYGYQANTIKERRVLSLVFLGLQVILHDMLHITLNSLMDALKWGKKDEIVQIL